jgi:hypothetical protein
MLRRQVVARALPLHRVLAAVLIVPELASRGTMAASGSVRSAEVDRHTGWLRTGHLRRDQEVDYISDGNQADDSLPAAGAVYAFR